MQTRIKRLTDASGNADIHPFEKSVEPTAGTALLAAGSIATGIGLLLPWIFQRLGSAPAYGSGPLGTVAQDVLSVMIYFACVSALLRIPA